MKKKKVYSKIRLLTTFPQNKLNKTLKKEEEKINFIQDNNILNIQKEIDSKIMNLWKLFIKFYNYEYYFTLNEEIIFPQFTFDLLKKLLFEDLDLSEEKMNLISKSEKGTYALQNSKIWIMYLKMKIEVDKKTLSDLFKIFQRSLSYNVNLLEMFSFFIIVLTECDDLEKEIEKMSLIKYSKEVPDEFIECWKINEKTILNIIEKKEKIDNEKMMDDIQNENNVSFQLNQENKNIDDQRIDDNIDLEKTNDDKSINIQNINKIIDGKENSNVDIEKINNEEKINSEKINENNSFLNSENKKKAISANKISFKKLSIIKESESENDNNNNISPNQEIAKKKLIKLNIIFNKKKELKENLIQSEKKNKTFSIEDKIEDFKFLDLNVDNNGNYALIEVNKDLEKQFGHKIIITPIKPKISNRKSSASDLRKVEKQYGDIYYQPFNESIIKKIESQKKTKEENKN